MGKTTISWTEQTWNPVRGCRRISPGCVNCYAERMAARELPGMNSPTTGFPFATMTQNGPRWTGKVELIPHMLDVPLKRRKPTTYFVNSMSDLFHEDLSNEDIDRVFAVMALCPQHTFQVLTKRADRMREYFKETPLPEFGPEAVAFDGAHARVFSRMVKILPTINGHHLNRTCELLDERYPGEEGFMRRWPLPNVMLGVSVEDQQRKDRIDLLRETPAAVRFLSLEPLLEDLGTIDLRGIDWVIVGGESGPGARPCDVAWIRSIVQQCKAAGVPVFVKQLGANVTGYNPHGTWVQSRPPRPHFYDPKGGDMAEWPEDLRVRELPTTGEAVSR